MKTPKLDEQIQQLQMYERNEELSKNGKEMLQEYNSIKEQLALLRVMDRLPESDYIRQQAQQMDEKEFEKWWWEIVYKGN